MADRPIITIHSYNPDWYPPCFESKDKYDTYMWTVAKVGLPMDCNNYCLDCTHEYKIDMLKEKRCTHPETIFVEWRTAYKKEEELQGKMVSQQNEPDTLGISNLSKFWYNPLYDQHPNKIKETPNDN